MQVVLVLLLRFVMFDLDLDFSKSGQIKPNYLHSLELSATIHIVCFYYNNNHIKHTCHFVHGKYTPQQLFPQNKLMTGIYYILIKYFHVRTKLFLCVFLSNNLYVSISLSHSPFLPCILSYF